MVSGPSEPADDDREADLERLGLRRGVGGGKVEVDRCGEGSILLSGNGPEDVVHDERRHLVPLGRRRPGVVDESGEVSERARGTWLDGIREADDVGTVGDLHEGVTDGHGHADERLCRRPVGWRDGDLGEQDVSHLDQQLLLVRHVPVEGAGRDPELAGQPPHREVCETVAAQEVDGGRDDLLTAECHALPRLRRTVPVDPR